MNDIKLLKQALSISMEINKTYSKLFQKENPKAATKKIAELDKATNNLVRILDDLIKETKANERI